MSDDEFDEGGYSLVMPFVTVASNGGPHDDESYVCGWEMGVLDYKLRAAKSLGMGPPTTDAPFRRSNLPQLDLICLKHGAICKEAEADPFEPVADEWVYVELTWGGWL